MKNLYVVPRRLTWYLGMYLKILKRKPRRGINLDGKVTITYNISLLTPMYWNRHLRTNVSIHESLWRFPNSNILLIYFSNFPTYT